MQNFAFFSNLSFMTHLFITRNNYTAKRQYRKFETNIPEKELRGHRTTIHINGSVSDLYSNDRSAYSAAGNMWTDINRSEIHKCENWDWGRAIFFREYINGIFRCSVKGNITQLNQRRFLTKEPWKWCKFMNQVISRLVNPCPKL